MHNYTQGTHGERFYFLGIVSIWCVCMQKCYCNSNTARTHDHSTNTEVIKAFVPTAENFRSTAQHLRVVGYLACFMLKKHSSWSYNIDFKALNYRPIESGTYLSINWRSHSDCGNVFQKDMRAECGLDVVTWESNTQLLIERWWVCKLLLSFHIALSLSKK